MVPHHNHCDTERLHKLPRPGSSSRAPGGRRERPGALGSGLHLRVTRGCRMSDVSSISRDTQHAIYRKMYLMKANDERLRKLLRTGRIVATYYSYRGQEVIPAALSVNLTDDDYLCTIYRGIHDMIGKGLPLKDLWAEIAGRVDGTCKGKGGPMHLTYPSKGIMVTTGVVGASMPIANGLAWAAQLSNDGRVAVACFGDGAS